VPHSFTQCHIFRALRLAENLLGAFSCGVCFCRGSDALEWSSTLRLFVLLFFGSLLPSFIFWTAPGNWSLPCLVTRSGLAFDVTCGTGHFSRLNYSLLLWMYGQPECNLFWIVGIVDGLGLFCFGIFLPFSSWSAGVSIPYERGVSFNLSSF